MRVSGHSTADIRAQQEKEILEIERRVIARESNQRNPKLGLLRAARGDESRIRENSSSKTDANERSRS